MIDVLGVALRARYPKRKSKHCSIVRVYQLLKGAVVAVLRLANQDAFLHAPMLSIASLRGVYDFEPELVETTASTEPSLPSFWIVKIAIQTGAGSKKRVT
ncbi:MAG TPA: hypothetical protein VGM27_18460 [Acidobacteriaceae bacterium]